jgi:hypothetical protein
MRLRPSYIVPLIGGTFLAMYPMMTTPILVGGLVDGAHLSGEQAGWIGTVSIGTVAAASMLLPGVLHRYPGRLLPVLFAGMLVFGYAGFGLAGGFGAFTLFAILSGAGSGGLLAAMAMRIAKSDHPDRIYGILYATASIVFAALLFVLPRIGEAWGIAAEFRTLALVALLVTPLLQGLSVDIAPEEARHAAGRARPWAMIATVVLVMTIAFPLYGGVYAFCERRAVDIGLGPSAVGFALAAATVMTVIGALIVAWVGVRPGRAVPTMVTMAVATAAYGLVLGGRAEGAYMVGMLAFGLMQMALNSYFFGLASALDREGRVAAVLQGYSLIPYALGAGLFGSLAGGGDLSRLALPAMAINIVAALILLPMLLRLDRRAKAV